MIKAFIRFKNDPSVGMFAETFTMELPFYDRTEVEAYGTDDFRQQIAMMYNEWYADSLCRVWFDFENDAIDQTHILLAEQHRNTRHDAVDKVNETIREVVEEGAWTFGEKMANLAKDIMNMKQREPKR